MLRFILKNPSAFSKASPQLLGNVHEALNLCHCTSVVASFFPIAIHFRYVALHPQSPERVLQAKSVGSGKGNHSFIVIPCQPSIMSFCPFLRVWHFFLARGLVSVSPLCWGSSTSILPSSSISSFCPSKWAPWTPRVALALSSASVSPTVWSMLRPLSW